MYMEGLCDVDVLNELRRRLDGIKLDSVLESNYIEEMIQDHRYSPFQRYIIQNGPMSLRLPFWKGALQFSWKARPLFWWFPPCSSSCFNRARIITSGGILPAWFDCFDTYASE